MGEDNEKKSVLWGKNDQESFMHISNHAELVILRDRDVAAFIPGEVNFDATKGMQLYRDSSGDDSSLLHSVKNPNDEFKIKSSERVLLWTRISGNKVVSGLRWVPYLLGDNPDDDESYILPFREVYAPRIEYDRVSNMLHLWFWTNVNADYNSSEYKESEIYPIGFSEYDTLVTSSAAKRVLCYAEGNFSHLFVKGGLVKIPEKESDEPEGDESDSPLENFSDEESDLVPVFTQPIILNNYDITAKEVKNPGLITDGMPPTGGGFPMGPKWLWGLELELHKGEDEDDESDGLPVIKVYNPVLHRAGLTIGDWIAAPSNHGNIPNRACLKSITTFDDWKIGDEDDDEIYTARLGVGYKYDQVTNTGELVISTNMDDLATFPTDDGAGTVDPMRYYKIPLYIISANFIEGDESADPPTKDRFTAPQIYIDLVHGLFTPGLMA